MGISEQERVRRRDSVGASDVPAILGLCPFRTIHDVYLDKTANMNMAANDLRDNMAILVGEKMEMSVVHYGYEKFKDNNNKAGDLKYDEKIVVKKSGKAPKHANLDGSIYLKNSDKLLAIVEAKTSSVSKNWGLTGSERIPPNVMAQVQFQMGLAGVKCCIVSLLLSAFRLELRTYKIDFEPETFSEICKAVDEFWLGYVETRTPPLPSLPSRENLNRLERNPSTKEISDEVFEEITEKREKVRVAKEELEKAQLAAITSLEDCEEGFCSLGTITYREQNRKAYQVSAKSMRVLRTKAVKKKEKENE